MIRILFKNFKKQFQLKQLSKLVFQRNLRWYIWHEDKKVPENGVAIFGPFEYKELATVMNDAFADALAECGDLEEFQMTDEEAAKFYINTRAYWLKQAADLTDD
jgi:hypothetical protein